MGTCLQVIHHGSNTLLERKAVKKTETARFPAVRGGATKPRGEPAPAQMTGPREAVVAGAAEETTSRGGDALLRRGGLGQGRRSQDGAHERRGDADALLTATTGDRGRAHGHGASRGLGWRRGSSPRSERRLGVAFPDVQEARFARTCGTWAAAPLRGPRGHGPGVGPGLPPPDHGP